MNCGAKCFVASINQILSMSKLPRFPNQSKPIVGKEQNYNRPAVVWPKPPCSPPWRSFFGNSQCAFFASADAATCGAQWINDLLLRQAGLDPETRKGHIIARLGLVVHIIPLAVPRTTESCV
jgi:hypothetical protein